jgi:protein-S-isoprenylcysteine O-methyltransferase Ste14
MVTPRWIAGALWIAWLVIWLVGAGVWRSSTARRQPLGSQLAYGVPMWVGVWLIFFFSRRTKLLGLTLLPVDGALSWLGVALVLCGLGFAVWARVHLGRNWSSTPVIKKEQAIVRSGPYGITRHPIYTGLLLALAGQALVATYVGAVFGLACVIAGVLLKIRQEETLLVGHFGDAYLTYRSEVPALVPSLRPRRHGA